MIFCFGDSHVSFFSGRDAIQPVVPEASNDLLPYFRTFHVGPALAYNLVQTETQTRGREKILETLEQQVPPGSRVLICFGEIDCRSHLLRHAWKQNGDAAGVAGKCAERYVRFACELRDRGHVPTVYNAIPSRHSNTRRDKWDQAAYPAIGTHRERNEITIHFNQAVAALCRNEGLGFLHNFPELVDASGKTREEFYMDRIHLSQRAMPLTLELFKKLYPDMDFSLPPTWKAPALRRRFSLKYPFTWLESAEKD